MRGRGERVEGEGWGGHTLFLPEKGPNDPVPGTTGIVTFPIQLCSSFGRNSTRFAYTNMEFETGLRTCWGGQSRRQWSKHDIS